MVTSLYHPADIHSRVILKSLDEDDFLTTYINANYLKVSENMCVCKLLAQHNFIHAPWIRPHILHVSC